MSINKKINFKFVVNLYNEILFNKKKKRTTTDRNNKDELYKHYIKHKKLHTQLHLYKVQEGKINLWLQKLENH